MKNTVIFPWEILIQTILMEQINEKECLFAWSRTLKLGGIKVTQSEIKR